MIRSSPSGGASGSSFEGRRPQPSAAPGQLLSLPPSPPFRYLAHPARWDVQLDEEGVAHIVPRLRELRFEAGLGGVQQVQGAAHGDPTAALAYAERDGWVLIPDDREVFAWGKEDIGYVREYSGRRGLIHLPVWARPRQMGLAIQMEWDEQGWLDFKLKLVSDKVIVPLDASLRALEAHLTRGRRLRMDIDRESSRAAADIYDAKLVAFKKPKPKPKKPQGVEATDE